MKQKVAPGFAQAEEKCHNDRLELEVIYIPIR